MRSPVEASQQRIDPSSQAVTSRRPSGLATMPRIALPGGWTGDDRSSAGRSGPRTRRDRPPPPSPASPRRGARARCGGRRGRPGAPRPPSDGRPVGDASMMRTTASPPTATRDRPPGLKASSAIGEGSPRLARGRQSRSSHSATLIRMARSLPSARADAGELQAPGEPQQAVLHLALVAEGEALLNGESACCSSQSRRACCARASASASAAALVSARRHCHRTRVKPRTAVAAIAETSAASVGRRRALRRLLQQGRRPGEDRPAGQEAVEVLGQGRRAVVSSPRVLLQASQADRLQVVGHRRPQPTGRDRLLGRTRSRVSSIEADWNGGRPVSIA